MQTMHTHTHTPLHRPPLAAFNSVNLAAGKNAVRALATLAVATPELLRAFSTPAPAAAASGDFVLVATSAAPVLDMAHGSAVLSALWPSAGSVTAVALVAWAGLGPGALGSVLQTYGQRSVSPPAAQARPRPQNTPLCLCETANHWTVTTQGAQ